MNIIKKKLATFVESMLEEKAQADMAEVGSGPVWLSLALCLAPFLVAGGIKVAERMKEDSNKLRRIEVLFAGELAAKEEEREENRRYMEAMELINQLDEAKRTIEQFEKKRKEKRTQKTAAVPSNGG